MKILHIIPSLQTGGAERLAQDICIELNKRKDHQVFLIFFNGVNSFNNHSFIKHIPSSISLSIKSKNKYNIGELEKKIYEFKPDVIHTHLFEADIVSRSIKYSNAKWFSHLHDNMPQIENFNFRKIFVKKHITNLYEKMFFKQSIQSNNGNHFICISNDTFVYLKNVIPNSTHTLLPNAINYKIFYNNKEYIENNKLELINIGSFQAKKNQKFLIKVAQVLKRNKIRFHLTLLGEGEFYKTTQKLAELFGLENDISFIGNVQNVEKYLDNSDIYIHSAYYEPFGLVLLEAMAAGLPVITLDGKGNRDIIEQGKNGYMIYEQDEEKFANTIVELWNNKEKMNEISKFANKFAKQFDIVEYVDKLLELYQNAIDLKSN